MEATAVNNLANLEALLNIIANGCEILGIACGGAYLIFCWIPYALGTRGYSLKLLAGSILALISGLATPGIISWSVAAGGPLGGIFAALIAGLIVLALCLTLTFAPTIIAFREKRQARKWIAGLNCCVFVPFFYLVALVLASRADPIKLEDGFNVNDHR